MIGLEDRQACAQDIRLAHEAGARLRLACATAGIDVRTLQRWKTPEGLIRGDGRPGAVRPLPEHALSPAERAELLRVANEPRFADVPPASTWRVNLPLSGCYAITDRALAAAEPRHPGPTGPPPRTLPRPRAKSGAGT
jgi:hypothetical protein